MKSINGGLLGMPVLKGFRTLLDAYEISPYDIFGLLANIITMIQFIKQRIEEGKFMGNILMCATVSVAINATVGHQENEVV